VLNGEVYNFLSLRDTLEGSGHRFATRSDTEVVAHAYEEYGERFVDRLDGMFAIAIWDSERERLVLARDRFGKKPLFYWASGASFAFASELQALMLVPGLRRDLDPEALGDYLGYMAIPAPRTIYRDVRKLPPAHVLVADRQGCRLGRYWSLSYEPKLRITETDAAEQVRTLLEAAVRKRLVGEVPLGAFLSGGVDSGGVVALMARLTNRPVKTFSIGFEESRYDELPAAKQVAEAFGCEHHEFIVRPRAVEILPALARHFGEPYADSSAIPTAHLAALTRAHVTVALTGDGGDEMFAGYQRHLGARLAEQWKVAAHFGQRWAETPLDTRRRWGRLRRFVASSALSRAERYRTWAGVFSPEAIAVVSDGAGDGVKAVADIFHEVTHLDAVDAALAIDTRHYLPTDLLPKMDITTMMYSLEARSPLLDRELAEFVARLPTSLKIKRWSTKYVLKKALDGIIPSATVRRPKQGFAVPIGAWFRGELRVFLNDHLRHGHCAAAGIVRQNGVDALLDAHGSGKADRSHELWTVLMLELWYRECVAA
jgi:asparagine synthase (glutamine-hydrolysing)